MTTKKVHPTGAMSHVKADRKWAFILRKIVELDPERLHIFSIALDSLSCLSDEEISSAVVLYFEGGNIQGILENMGCKIPKIQGARGDIK